MNEQWKRIIEAERRVARLEASLFHAKQQIAGVQGQIQNSAQNVTNPFGSGGGETGGMHRFATNFEVWVEWSTVPTLKTSASSNPTADVTSLATAVSTMETGFLATNNTIFSPKWYFDHMAGSLFQSCDYRYLGISLYNKETGWNLNKYDGGNFLIDQDAIEDGDEPLADTDERSLAPTAGNRFYLSVRWLRRNGVGTIIGTDTLVAMRADTSPDTFSTGPTWGESGTWSFAMECPATTYHNAGSGTIYLRWGDPVTSIFSGGSPDDLPSDAFDGGTPASLPADIIDGGTI